MKALYLILSILLITAIFILDILFGLGAISLFYLTFVLAIAAFTTRKSLVVGSIFVSLILTIIGWTYQTRVTKIFIDLDIFKATMDYEGLFRVVSLSIIVFVGYVLFKQKKKEEELQKLNTELQLRILARTTASEEKAKRLEKQIEILQGIRRDSTYNSLDRLDKVILELKVLNNLEVENV